jgi:hypothetical protein
MATPAMIVVGPSTRGSGTRAVGVENSARYEKCSWNVRAILCRRGTRLSKDGICRVTGKMRGHDEFELLRTPLVPAGTDEFLAAKPSNPYEATGGWR